MKIQSYRCNDSAATDSSRCRTSPTSSRRCSPFCLLDFLSFLVHVHLLTLFLCRHCQSPVSSRESILILLRSCHDDPFANLLEYPRHFSHAQQEFPNEIFVRGTKDKSLSIFSRAQRNTPKNAKDEITIISSE